MKKQLYNTIRQLVMLFEALTLRRLLINRFVLVIVLAVLLTGGVQGYVSANNGGTIDGYVVDGNGDPVEGAQVNIQELGIRNQYDGNTTTTNEDGYFVFTGQTEFLEFRIRVTTENSQAVERHHLYFEGQEREVTIVLDAES
jgi:hypothetical protein